MSYSRWSTPLGLDTHRATGETAPADASAGNRNSASSHSPF